MINRPVFPVRTPQEFYEQLIAPKPGPRTGKPDEAKQGPAFSSGFEDSTFYGLNAFRFINAAGDSTPVRWFLEPEQQVKPAGAAGDKHYLFAGLIEQIQAQRRPLRWRLFVIVGQPGDATDDATRAWPEEREKVGVGTLTLDHVESDDTSAARDINFDPLVLPAGIEPSDDPLLSARSAVYSQSFTRRAGERKQPSAITAADVRKGD
jgi:catalase